MRDRAKQNRIVQLSAVFLVGFLVAAGLFYLCNRFDNKYTKPGPQPIGGVLLLSEAALEEHPVVYPILQWEIYRDKLLSPEDFVETPPLPDELVFIGQYGGFEGHTENGGERSPHGSASYRLNIFLPPERRSYTLELPEIYSAYKLYLNGVLVKEMGGTDPARYRPETGVSTVTLQAEDRIEILIAVSDYSHFYSGMVYPPAFGEPESIATRMNWRLTLRVAACACALGIGLLYLLVGLFGSVKNKKGGRILPFLYAALCLCFTLYICHPLLKTLSFGGMTFYTIEKFAYCAMLLLVILIQGRLSGVGKIWMCSFGVLGGIVCSFALLLPLIAKDSLPLMLAYSNTVQLYTWASAVYLTICAGYSIYQGKTGSIPLLLGMAVFDAALVMDRIYPMFEPIRFGWFIELAGGVLVGLIGITLAIDVGAQLRMRHGVEARIESVAKMLEVQKAYYPVLLEKEAETKAARHDLRHHLSVIRTLVTEGKLDKLQSYLDEYSQQQHFSGEIFYCQHYLTNMLLRMYGTLAAGQNTAFIVKADLPESVPIKDMDLCVILSNLLENALEASAKLDIEQREISVHIGCKLHTMGIFVENRFSGTLEKKNGRFYSQKQRNREGVGLSSVESTVLSYGGSVSFQEGSPNRFCCEVYLPVVTKRKTQYDPLI